MSGSQSSKPGFSRTAAGAMERRWSIKWELNLAPPTTPLLKQLTAGRAMNNSAQACETALRRRKANPITQTRPVPSRANGAGSGVGVGVIVSTPVSSFPVVKS